MATDGVSLFYNPEFVAKLTPPELLGAWHTKSCIRRCNITPGGGHVRRNVGMSLATSPSIHSFGMQTSRSLPGHSMIRPFRNLSAERIYNLIAEEKTATLAAAVATAPRIQVRRSFGSGGRAVHSSVQGSSDRRRIWPGHGWPNPDKEGAPATSDQIEKQQMSWTGAVEQAEVVARYGWQSSGRSAPRHGSGGSGDRGLEAALRNSFAAAIPEDYSWSSPTVATSTQDYTCRVFARMVWARLRSCGLLWLD